LKTKQTKKLAQPIAAGILVTNAQLVKNANNCNQQVSFDFEIQCLLLKQILCNNLFM